VRAIRRFTVRPVLPEPLRLLSDLATNLRWSWHPETQDVFAAIDPEIWRESGRDPVKTLGAVSSARLQELAADKRFVRIEGATHYYVGQPELLKQCTDALVAWSHEKRLLPGGMP